MIQMYAKAFRRIKVIFENLKGDSNRWTGVWQLGFNIANVKLCIKLDIMILQFNTPI